MGGVPRARGFSFLVVGNVATDRPGEGLQIGDCGGDIACPWPAFAEAQMEATVAMSQASDLSVFIRVLS